jgi:hypothetical protein
MATQNNNIDNVSDVFPAAGVNANISPQQLPVRGEKRIISSPVSPQDVNDQFEDQYERSGQVPPNLLGYPNSQGRQQLVEQDDFNVTAAMSPYVDYIIVRLYNRGLDGNGQPSGSPAVYRFLINPSQVVVNRTTLDGQAFARSGWQIGVWGEDSLSISLTGKTAGQYFAFGLTDRYQPFTESYRNLEQLQVVFENNGYWFEGEQQAEGPLAAGGSGFSEGANFVRRIIKMHADVELIVGNFMWYGMFESLTISQNADTPFLMDFQIQFIAWKERFRKQAPYKDTIHNDVKRGHDYGAWLPTAIAAQQATQNLGAAQSVSLTPNTPTTPTPTSLVVPPAPVFPVSPAVASAQASSTFAQVDPTANDTTYITPALDPTDPTQFGTWNGILSPLTIGNGGKNI